MRVPHIGESEEPQSMSAMSDVVFLLLIFFIVDVRPETHSGGDVRRAQL